MASEQKKKEAVEGVRFILEDLEEIKAEKDSEIEGIFLSCGINDKEVQKAIKKVAQALVKDKVETCHAEAAEIENLCKICAKQMPLFQPDGWTK